MSEMKVLIGKLDPLCKRTIEAAAALCITKTHYTVELDHFLLKLFETPDSDIQAILRYYEIANQPILKQFWAILEKLPKGCTGTPALSPHILSALEQAWLISSLSLNQTQIRSGAILLALVDNDSLRGLLLESCPLLLRLSRHVLRQDLPQLLIQSPEHILTTRNTSAPSPEKESPEKEEGRQPTWLGGGTPREGESYLEQYTLDLTEKASKGELDPIYGRENELDQVIHILCRRRQNNPILVGEAGVGKTAVVEALAQKIVKKAVPHFLQNVRLKVLDMTLLQAGASVQGQFEERLKGVLEEVSNSPHPIILFIDEAHSLIGAGGQAGLRDAANILKPVLARGELRTIAATTWAEYKKFFERDAALSRRFELVKVFEPRPDQAVEMLRPVAQKLASHHCVPITEDAIQAAVRLSDRFLAGRKLPDKALSILDTACARVSIAQSTSPRVLEELENQSYLLKIEHESLRQELQHGGSESQHSRLEEIVAHLEEIAARKESLSQEWEQARQHIEEIRSLRQELNDVPQNGQADSSKELAASNGVGKSFKNGAFTQEETNKQIVALKGRLKTLSKTLKSLPARIQIPIGVDLQTVASVISDATSIPEDLLLSAANQLDAAQLLQALQKNIVSQHQGLEKIARQISSHQAGLGDPHKPIGVFLISGPSGVGKSETAQALAEILTGHSRNLIRFNMTEFQEAHSIASLKGAPPGYVGYGVGGTLTEAVRRAPYSVILLDEIEKAHPDVVKLFYQVFDRGTLEDGEGVEVSFKNTVIILTTNVGATALVDKWQEPKKSSEDRWETLATIAHQELAKHFDAAFLSRLTSVPYIPLERADISQIIRLKLDHLSERLQAQHRAQLKYQDDFVDSLVASCSDVYFGARAIDHHLNQHLIPNLSVFILQQKQQQQTLKHIHLNVGKKEKTGDQDIKFSVG